MNLKEKEIIHKDSPTIAAFRRFESKDVREAILLDSKNIRQFIAPLSKFSKEYKRKERKNQYILVEN